MTRSMEALLAKSAKLRDMSIQLAENGESERHFGEFSVPKTCSTHLKFKKNLHVP